MLSRFSTTIKTRISTPTGRSPDFTCRSGADLPSPKQPRRKNPRNCTTQNSFRSSSPLLKLTVNLPTTSPPKPMLASRPLPLLVCSVGNPGSQFANTLHSAGHTVLNRLADRLGYPGFHKDRQHGNGLISKPSISGASGDWTLWQSTSYMNESGKGVRAAYMAWAKTNFDGEGRLVIVHDELEKPLGAVTLKTGQGLSAKGHNGLKSIMSVMGNTPFVRIGIGIGRPVSRESNDVARYVLKKMDASEKMAMEGSIEQVIAKLKQLESG